MYTAMMLFRGIPTEASLGTASWGSCNELIEATDWRFIAGDRVYDAGIEENISAALL
jgi:hypothetical protein